MFLLYRRPLTVNKNTPRINDEITAQEIRLIDVEGKPLGILSLKEALLEAEKLAVDLVEIASQSSPPVCKLMNYGKFKYEQQKKKSEAKKKQKNIEIKEIQMRPVIEENDFQVKCKAIRRFLDEGNKVKIVIRFRGREIAHQAIGLSVLQRVKDSFECKIEFEPKLEGKQIIMVIAPLKG